MKFAKTFQEDLVPEWKGKYFNYKQGKKKVKAVAQARIKAYGSTPGIRPLRTPTALFAKSPKRSPHDIAQRGLLRQSTTPSRTDTLTTEVEIPQGEPDGEQTETKPIPIPGRSPGGPGIGNDATTTEGPYVRYGSIIASPPEGTNLGRERSFDLPGPALDPDQTSLRGQASQDPGLALDPGVASDPTHEPPPTSNAFEVGPTRHPIVRHASLPSVIRTSGPRGGATPSTQTQNSPLLRRIFRRPTYGRQNTLPADIPLQARQEIENKKQEFVQYLNSELKRIEDFYLSREKEAELHLQLLRAQLHELRNQRAMRDHSVEDDSKNDGGFRRMIFSQDGTDQSRRLSSFAKPVQKVAKKVHYTSAQHSKSLATPPTPAQINLEADGTANKDYQTKQKYKQTSYPEAKKKLKKACTEHYHEIELLKSYALLNREAFRKINKKYDKAIDSSIKMEYMNQRVKTAHFVKSEVLDKLLDSLIDFYARYFENGNRKVAVAKLKKTNAHAGTHGSITLANGLCLASALWSGIQGAVLAFDIVLGDSDDSSLRLRTSYLLQLYAGYLLINLLFLFFCIDCRIFDQSKVSYPFIFEFDTRHNLDWQQLSAVPCLFSALLGLTMWLNFHQYGGQSMYIYWPVILFGVTAILMFLPFKTFYHQSRWWLIRACWRLLLSGAFPVEFRDFFLGDMFCSLTYSMGNIELFFCLYAHHWHNEPQCNSSHSRLLGFLTTLPGIWRAIQCIRRWKDSRLVHPHITNFGKYCFTVAAGAALSIYRIDKRAETKAAYIALASLNTVYVVWWDIFHDWSFRLGLSDMEGRLQDRILRKQLAYKYVWFYYLAIPIDVVLRCNWIVYAITVESVQHSTIGSFAVALSEAIRRGIWCLIRVENEHCNNVIQYRISRNIKYPYSLPAPDTHPMAPLPYPVSKDDQAEEQNGKLSKTTSRFDPSSGGSSLRRRPTRTSGAGEGPAPSPSIRQRIGTFIGEAHAQDFERRKSVGEEMADEDDDDDDSDEDIDPEVPKHVERETV